MMEYGVNVFTYENSVDVLGVKVNKKANTHNWKRSLAKYYALSIYGMPLKDKKI